MNRNIRNMVQCSLFAALIALCGWISIPVPPVAFTLQTFGVLMALGVLGGKWGTVSILLYLSIGIVVYMPNGIRCNAIAPGGIVTEISTSMGMPNMNGYNRVKNVMATAPAPGSPEQIASAALFLASDDSSYVSGDVLLVDGGWAAG